MLLSARRRAVCACALLAVATTGMPAGAAEGTRFVEAVRGSSGVVATEDEHASRAAVAVLDAGGNAVDAAVAAVLTIGVTRPEMCGIGGGGFLVARSPDGDVRTLDFREKAPSVGYEFVRGMREPTTGLETFGTGHGAVGVPGVVAGLSEAHARLGSGNPDTTWAALVEPAIRAAQDGFVLHEITRRWIDFRALDLSFFPASARTLLPAAAQSEAGRPVTFPEYAATLERIAADPRDFYDGQSARTLAAEMQRQSPYADFGDRSAMTLQDLQDYRPVWREPVSTTYRGHEVHGMAAPTSGGTAIAEMLNILERFDLRDAGRSSADALHLVAEAQKIAWADRAAYLGDPDFVDVPHALTTKGYGQRRSRDISMTQAAESYSAYAGGRQAVQGSTGMHTTHVSVLDRDGGAVAVTCSIERPLGSAVVVDGGGYLLNNQLTDFDDDPLSPNRPEPGKRPRSSMSPTLVVRDGQPVLVVGGQGGPTIIMGVLQAVLGTVDFDLDPARALDAERLDARGFDTVGTTLHIEEARIAPDVLAELEQRGHVLQRAGEYAGAPGLNAVGSQGGSHLAAGDPRQPRAPMAQTP